MSPRFLQANAFTTATRPFAGNPAAVVLLDEPRDGAWMQLVAREFNLSETAFVSPREAASTCSWNLRWFTPRAEVELCGHATLASAHALREWNLARGDVLHFHTLSGILSARFDEDAVVLDFPATPPEPAEMPGNLMQVLAAPQSALVWCGRSRFDIVLQLDSEESVASLAPDFAALKSFEARGVCVTAQSSGGKDDFVSRFFAPRLGVDEDPVTGSAHCALAPFWAEKLGRNRLRARQISERGGEIGLQVLAGRVELSGGCVTMLRGEVLT